MIVQVLVERGTRSKLQRLLVTDTKDPKHAQTVVKQIVNPRLQILVEIDHHVATADYLKLVEGTVCGKIVFGKHYVALKCRAEDHAIILRRIIVRKLMNAPGLMVVACVFSHSREWKYAISRLPKNRLADIGGVDSAPVIQSFLVEQDCQ